MPALPPPNHTHFTRDIKAQGAGCPACDRYWSRQHELLSADR